MGDPVATIVALEHFAELALARHAAGPAVGLFAATAHLRDEIAFHDEEIALADARATLGDDAIDQAWREGHSMNWRRAGRAARERHGLGRSDWRYCFEKTLRFALDGCEQA